MEELLSGSAITAAEVDSILRDGGNSGDASPLRIAARFAKGAAPEEQAACLRREYLQGRHGQSEAPSGKGFVFGGHRVAAWFDESGIHLGGGDSSALSRGGDKIRITWEQAAARVNELMLGGRYVSSGALAGALDSERRELAERLLDFYRDSKPPVPEEWGANGGYPEARDEIKRRLDIDGERGAILKRLETDIEAWKNGPEGSGSRHGADRLLADMRAAMLPSAAPPGGAFAPEGGFSRFITEDEIDACMARSSGYSESKFRILSCFLSVRDEKERTSFLKNEYGTGGGSWSAGNGWTDHSPSGGITIKRGRIMSPEAETTIRWPAAAKRVARLIGEGRYMSRAELGAIPGYERLMLARRVSGFYNELPQEYERPFSAKAGIGFNERLDFHYPHEAEREAMRNLFDDAGRIDGVLAQMRQILGSPSEDGRRHEARKAAYEDLAAFREGRYTLFPGIEGLPGPEASAARRAAAREGPRREAIEDLRESPGGFPGAAPPRGEQLSLFGPDSGPLPVLPGVIEQREKIEQKLRHEAERAAREAGAQAPALALPEDPGALFLNIAGEDKARIAAQFAGSPRSREAVNLVREIYGGALNMPLPQAMKRIAELAADGKFETQEPPSFFGRVREELAERGFAVSDELIGIGISGFNAHGGGNGDFQDAADFIENEYLAEEPEFAEETELAAGAPKSPEQPARPYAAGDTVWLNDREFQVEAIGDYYKEPRDGLDRRFLNYGRDISLLDMLSARNRYPISRSMYQANFERELANDGRNAHLAPLGEPAAQAAEPVPESAEGEPSEPMPEPEPEAMAEPMPPPDFDTAARTVYGRVMADENYAYCLRFAENRSALRKPLNDALDKAVAELKEAEPAIYRDYFDDDVSDNLFDYVYRQSWANRPTPATAAEQPAAREELSEGFAEITDPAELAEIERIFGGGQEAEPLAVIDNVSRNNFNLFALAFPRLIDGTYQSMTFKDANKRELSVSYATTGANAINLDVSHYRPDGHRAFAPMIQFRVNHVQRMLAVNGYADDDRKEDAGFLRLADKDQLSELNVRAYGFLSNIRNIGFDLANPFEVEVFIDADGNPLTAEPKADIGAFLKERADRESDAHGRVQASMFAPLPESEPEPGQKPAPAPKPARNFRITDDHLGEGGAKTKFRNNVAALQALKAAEREGRPATPDEQETLSR
ncbi:MAG: hypothetical protein LBL83_08480, partial [Clostridiales bacterium]|nr:hypothetical protein [Clostridiales bacterium]